MAEVRLLGDALRRAIGTRSLALHERTLRELLLALSQRGGPELAGRLYALVNGRNALFLDGLDTQLCESDVVTVHFAGARAFPGG
jgi:molybdopterin converting factor small subunit